MPRRLRLYLKKLIVFCREGLDLVAVKPLLGVKGGRLDFESHVLEGFGHMSLILTAKAANSQEFTIAPHLKYINQLGEIKTILPKPAQVKVLPLKEQKIKAMPETLKAGSPSNKLAVNLRKGFIMLQKEFGKRFCRPPKSRTR